MLSPGVQIVSINSPPAPRGRGLGNRVPNAPQMIRHGIPVVPGQGAIALPPGMQSAFLVRVDGSPYRFNVAPPPGIQANSVNSPNTAYRLQSLTGATTPGIRTPSHQQVVRVPVSSAIVNTLQRPTVPGIRTLSHLQVVQVPVTSAAGKILQGATMPVIRTLSHQVVPVPVSPAAVKTLQTGPRSIVRFISPQQMASTSQAKSQPVSTGPRSIVRINSPQQMASTSQAKSQPVSTGPRTIVRINSPQQMASTSQAKSQPVSTGPRSIVRINSPQQMASTSQAKSQPVSTGPRTIVRINSPQQMASTSQAKSQPVSTGPRSIVRINSPQQMASTSQAKSQPVSTGPGSIARIISPQQKASTSRAKRQPVSSTVVNTVLQQTTTSITRSTLSAETFPGHMSLETIKTKKIQCQNFLSSLIRLAGDASTKTASNVKKLIQNLIDGVIEPEDFLTQLEKELQSKGKPYLINFLNQILPYVRLALMSGEMKMEGIRPPPMPAFMQNFVPTTQIRSLRPILAPTTRGILSSTGGNSASAAQLFRPLSGNTISTQRFLSPRFPQSMGRPIRPFTIVSTAGSSTSYSGLVQSSPANVGALQSKIVLPNQVSIKPTSTPKEKKSFVSVRNVDDINDVAAMGGVNLVEESKRATGSELIGSQIRSCKDDHHFLSSALHRKVLQIAKKKGLEEVPSEVVDLISRAAEKRLKTIIEKLSVIAEHRCENPKNDPRYEVTNDVKAQLKFLEDLDKLEKKRHDDEEKEKLLKAAKSRSKSKDPELLKLKRKAQEMQRAEIEELRRREANMTALLAIGPRKKFKPDLGSASGDQAGNGESSGSSNSGPKPPIRPRVKRVFLEDLLFTMENDPKTARGPLLYKYYAR